jgi:ABC-type glycerol-3-phosphate transport system substrate-binding protein
MKKMLFWCLVLLLTVNCLYAGGKQEGAVGAIELRWFNWHTPEWGDGPTDYMLDTFYKENPDVKISLVTKSWAAAHDTIVASAAGGEFFDVAECAVAWLTDVYRQGVIEDLEPWIKKEGKSFEDKLTGITRASWDNKTVAFRHMLFFFGCSYNEDIFENRGLQPPTGWDEFEELSETLTDASKNQYAYAMALNLKDPFQFIIQFSYRLAQFGGQYIDKSGRPALDSPQAIAALEYWKSYYDKGYVMPGALGMDNVQVMELIATEQIPMRIYGNTIWTTCKQTNPDIRLAFTEPWRDVTGGSFWNGDTLVMSSKGKNKDASWEFIKFFFDNDEFSKEMTGQTSIPTGGKVALASLGEFKDDPLLRMGPAIANNDPDHDIVWPVLPEGERLILVFGEAVHDVLNDKIDAKTALTKVNKVWIETIEKAK